MDEVAFALEERKTVIPVLHEECRLPFRLRRLQYIDLKSNYEQGLRALLVTLADQEQIASAADPTEEGEAEEAQAEEAEALETAEAEGKAREQAMTSPANG
jgi:hypothetical protein